MDDFGGVDDAPVGPVPVMNGLLTMVLVNTPDPLFSNKRALLSVPLVISRSRNPSPDEELDADVSNQSDAVMDVRAREPKPRLWTTWRVSLNWPVAASPKRISIVFAPLTPVRVSDNELS